MSVPVEVIEQDSADAEDIKDLQGFLRQGMPPEDNLVQMTVSFNRRVLDGWVKQPSPCCGAASVAGAWNALACLHRRDPGALRHMDILQIYHSMFFDMIEKHMVAFERRLGASMFSIISQIEEELRKKGREIGGKKGFNASKAAVVSAIKRLAIARLKERQQIPRPDNQNSGSHTEAAGCEEGQPSEASVPVPPSPETAPLDLEAPLLVKRDAIDCFIELFELDGVILNPDEEETVQDADASAGTGAGAGAVMGPESVHSVGAAAGGEDNDEGEDDSEDEGEDENCDPLAVQVVSSSANTSAKRTGKKGKVTKSASTGAGGASAGTGAGQQWDWKKDLMKIIQNTAGMRKIIAPRPSTAAIGNWGILQVVQRLSEWAGLGTSLQARLFMGKKTTVKSKVDHALSRKDSENAIAAQWEALKGAFTRSDTVLLFHLKNHYALVFALREWVQYEYESQGECEGAVPQSASEGSASSQPQPQQSAGIKKLKHRRQLLAARKGQRPTAWIDFEEARETMLGWEGYKMMVISFASDVLAPHDLAVAKICPPEEYLETLKSATATPPATTAEC